ncbi:MAG: hypothetical protein K8F59_01255 [Rhodobacteraceae bacterium]|nr:hypothetical protein [Paracoccaceae bacterium]
MRLPLVLAAVMALADPLSAQVAPRADGQATPYREVTSSPVPCPPLAILSHGFGGSEAELPQLASMLAERGFRVIVMGHRESGPAQLRAVRAAPDRWAAIVAAAGDPAAHRARFLDLDAIWAMATATCRPDFALMAGHSMGAQTTIMEAGAVARFGPAGRNRFDAYVALSPQGVGQRFSPGAWAAITRPVLMVTGTRDMGVDGDYTTRLSAFEGLPGGNKRLAVISGATHFNLGGRGFGPVALVPRLVSDWLDDLDDGRLDKPQPVPGVTFRQK